MALKRRGARLLGTLAAAVALLALADGYRWWQATRTNAAIRAEPMAEPAVDEAPQIVFARAWRHAAAGDYHRAVTAYREAASRGDEALRQAALYNSANLHLREALRLREQGAEPQVLPLLEMAKQGYRDVLHADPGYWDAKYNLERALRLAPDTDEDEAGALTPPPPSERAATTMKAFTLGLP